MTGDRLDDPAYRARFRDLLLRVAAAAPQDGRVWTVRATVAVLRNDPELRRVLLDD